MKSESKSSSEVIQEINNNLNNKAMSQQTVDK